MAKARASKPASAAKSRTSPPKKKAPLKDPEGGLTAAGRAAYKKSEGAILKPGVKKALKDMTLEELRRKGSFLRRHFATLRGPLVGDDGQSTRLALQAHAWGEPVPRTAEAARKLAAKGEALLERYKKSKARAVGPTAAKKKAAPQAKAQRSTSSSASTYTRPALRDRLKAKILAGEKGGKAGQWSARKAQLLAAEYKKAGGDYTKDKAHESEAQQHLEHWTAEGWTTSDGKAAVRDGETARYLPKKAWEKLTATQKKATNTKKTTASKAGQQYVANTEAAKSARKSASRPNAAKKKSARKSSSNA